MNTTQTKLETSRKVVYAQTRQSQCSMNLDT